MKKNLLISVLATIILGSIIYYMAPRHVRFELVKTINQPHRYFDRTNEELCDYVYDRDCLRWWLKGWYSTSDFFTERGIIGYDSAFVENIANNLDFDDFDYVITYQRELNGLKHSPYLSHKDASYYFDKRTPLIPVFKDEHTTKVYIYRIEKNTGFRSVGP